MIGMSFAMAFSTIVAMLVGRVPALALVALALWGLGYGLLASLGPSAAAIGLNATIAFVVFSNYPASGSPLGIAAWIMLAGLIQTLLLVVLWPVQRYPEERRSLATAYRALSAYASKIGSVNAAAFPQSNALQGVRAALADPRPFGRRAANIGFQMLADHAELLRTTLGAIALSDGQAFSPVREQTAALLDRIASAIEEAREPDSTVSLESDAHDPLIAELMSELRSAVRIARVPMRGFKFGPPTTSLLLEALPDLEVARGVVRANLSLSSPFGRHALRLAVVLTIAGSVAHLLPAQRGYWITLTAAIILRPDYTSTLARGLARIAGTAIGVVAATALVVVVPHTQHVSLVLAILFASLGFAAFQLNFGLYSACITAYIVFLIALLGAPGSSAIGNRLVMTLIGGVLAMISYVVWPTWEAPQTCDRLAHLLDVNRRYIAKLFEGLIDPARHDVPAAKKLESALWGARGAADESLERMLSEPEATHDIEAETALSAFATARRLAFMSVLLTGLYRRESVPAMHDLANIALKVDESIARIVDDLQTGKASPESRRCQWARCRN